MSWKLEAYSDSNWDGDTINCWSITGWCLIIDGKTVTWVSKQQRNITESSTEAEYVAAATVWNEILFF